MRSDTKNPALSIFQYFIDPLFIGSFPEWQVFKGNGRYDSGPIPILGVANREMRLWNWHATLSTVIAKCRKHRAQSRESALGSTARAGFNMLK